MYTDAYKQTKIQSGTRSEISQGVGPGLKERTEGRRQSGLPISSVTDEFDHFEVDLAGFTAGSQRCTQTMCLKEKREKCHKPSISNSKRRGEGFHFCALKYLYTVFKNKIK